MTDEQAANQVMEADDRTQAQWERSGENWEWIVQHPELLEPFRGEYVVIWQRRILAHGQDPAAVRAQVQATPCWNEPFLAFRAPTRDEIDGILAL